MIRPGALVGISFAFVAVWFVLFQACTPALPAEGPITVTTTTQRDH